MARYNSTVESTTALVSTAPSGSTPGGLFANLALTAAGVIRLRRVTLGVRAGTGAPTSQQVTVSLARTSARGTGFSGNTPSKLDPNASASLASVDTAWSTLVPTATWTAPFLYEVSFNTQSGVDLPWELLEELQIQGSANGIAFFNFGNALPTSHLYTMALEWEE
jgi:hypothetical protein